MTRSTRRAGVARTLVARWSLLGRVRELPGEMRLLVGCQLAFNLGFYLVLPFFALHLANDLGLAGAAIGLLLGLRTFSQQGLFFLGGALADRFGTKPVAMTGFVIRIAGFVLLAFAEGLPLLIAGTVAVGFAAALFSPAVEAELARRSGQDTGGPPRSEVFAMFTVAGEIGVVVGPVVGGLLLAVDFAVTTMTAAGVFAVILVVFAVVMPSAPAAHAGEPMLGGWRDILRDRPFLAFTAAYSTWLLCYNQLYLALPAELTRVGATDAIGGLFALSAVLVVLVQIPLADVVRTRIGPARALPWGFGLLSAAFALTAILVALPPLPGPWRLLPAVVFVVLLAAGQMTVVPVAKDAVGRLAGERRLGSYFGVLASAGGLAVLGGSAALGALVESASVPTPAAALPWAVTALLPATSAVVMVVLARRVPALSGPVPPPEGDAP